MLITAVSIGLLFIVLTSIIIVIRLKSSNNRKRNSRQSNGDKQVIVHQRNNGQVATSILETDTDPDLIQVKYGKNDLSKLINNNIMYIFCLIIESYAVDENVG